MDVFRLNLLKENKETACNIITLANNLTPPNRMSKVRTCIALENAKHFMRGGSDLDYLNGIINIFGNVDIKLMAAIEEAYCTHLIDLEDSNLTAFEAVCETFDEYIKRQEEYDNIDPDIAKEVDDLVKEAEEEAAAEAEE